jgi:tetratricopeptide (TPR) repeat protein
MILGTALVVGVAGFFTLKTILVRANQGTFLDQARKADTEKRSDDALRYVNEYLKFNPASLDGLELKGKILAESSRDGGGVEEATRVVNQILAIDPTNKGARKRQIELNIRAGQYRAAQVAAEEYLKLVNDAEAHRLMGQALEGVGYLGDASALDLAMAEYEKAETMEPGDITGGLRLAQLYRLKGKDPARAVQVMNSLLKSNPNSAKARLARYHFFLTDPDSPGKLARALTELDEAIKIAPGDAEARVIAAEFAAQRGETVEARRHLAAINPPPKNELPIKLITGMIELQEQHEDAAIENWRSGLVQTGGTDVDLTWRLARLLLARGRIREAEPLLAQYRRLTGGTEPTAEYRFLRAISLTKTGRANEAVKELEAIRDKINRNFVGQLYTAIGAAYESMRDESKAIEAYRRATLSNDAGSAPWLSIVRLQLADRPADAIATLERGLASLPNEPSLTATLAQILWLQEASKPQPKRNWAEFERWIDKAEKAAPKSPEVAIVRAEYLAANGRGDEAAKSIAEACKRSPSAVALWLARATLLTQLNRPVDALGVLGEASKAAGDNAVFRTARARILLQQGETKAARDALIEGLDRVPDSQKPVIWKALGEYHQAQRDLVAARRAFEEWSRLQPDSAEPHLSLLNLAVARDDLAAMEAEVAAIKSISGTGNLLWKIARAEYLLQLKPKAPDDTEDKTRLAEVKSLIKEIKTAAPLQPSASLLEGQLMERRKRIDDAIAAYRKALDLRGGLVALRPLVTLLARENRNAELEALHDRLGSFPPDVERLAGTLKLRVGDTREAERLAKRFLQGEPQSLDAATWQAYVLKSLGKPAEAEQTLRTMTIQRPEDPAPWLSLLMFQVSRKDMTAANATVETMKLRVKTDRPELLWATCYRVLGSKPRADAAYDAALKQWPDDPIVRRTAIDYYELTGRLELAEQSLRHVLRVSPGLDWARRRLAIILSGRSNDPAAMTEAIALVAKDPKGADSPDDRLNRAVVLARSTDPRNRDEAIKILERLAAELPQMAILQDTLARSLVSAGRKAEARGHAAKAAAAPDTTPDSILLLAGLALEDKDYSEAEAQLARLTAINPKALPTIELGARILHAKGDDVAAVAALRAAFNDRKTAADGQTIGAGILKILMDLKRFDDAEALGRDLARLGPAGQIKFAEFLGGRGKIDQARAYLDAAAKAGDPIDVIRASLALATESDTPDAWLDQPEALLKTAMASRPDSLDLIQLLAYLRHLQKKYPDEIRLYHEIIKRKPGSLLFMNNMAWTLSEELGRAQDGLDRIDEALKQAGQQPHLLDTRGVILIRLGRFSDAVKDLETAAAALPTPPVFYHLARAYQKDGNKAEFEKYRAMAKKAGLKPGQLQPSERDEAAKLVGFAEPDASSKP